MPAISKRFTINESQIKKFTLKGGSVHGAVRRLTEEAEDVAVSIGPKRTGELVSTISSSERWSNGRQARFTLRVGASYASYVLRGVPGYIYPKHKARNRAGNRAGKRPGTFSGRVPRFPVGKSNGEPMASWTFADRVKGQAENNFLRRAVAIAMRRQGYL